MPIKGSLLTWGSNLEFAKAMYLPRHLNLAPAQLETQLIGCPNGSLDLLTSLGLAINHV